MTHRFSQFFLGLLILSVLIGAAVSIRAQQQPVMEHGDHGTAKGWKFTWPKGDPAKGREVFVKLECYSCHGVKGENFPVPSEKEGVGPELSAMGPAHDAEYFAEAIINPSAVIEKGKGYEAPDGSSKMPSFNHLVTVEEVVDLVAYLRALKPPAKTPPAPAHGPGMRH